MIKILEKDGVENTARDGARVNFSNTSGKNGVVKGILQECKITSNTTDGYVHIEPGYLILQGYNIMITEEELIPIPGDARATNLILAQLSINEGVPDFEFIIVSGSGSQITQHKIHSTENFTGVYQITFGSFSYSASSRRVYSGYVYCLMTVHSVFKHHIAIYTSGTFTGELFIEIIDSNPEPYENLNSFWYYLDGNPPLRCTGTAVDDRDEDYIQAFTIQVGDTVSVFQVSGFIIESRNSQIGAGITIVFSDDIASIEDNVIPL